MALTVAAVTGNDYERHQHERLSLKLGFSEGWVRSVIALEEGGIVQRTVLDLLRDRGRGADVDALATEKGDAFAVAVLLLTGRYLMHSTVVNARPGATRTVAIEPVTASWISEGEVVERLDLPHAIDAIERALAREAAGTAKTMMKTHLAWGDGHTLHAIGGVDGDLVGSKTWAHTAGGANPLLILWDTKTGERRAVIEAFALGQLRTAAVSGLATRMLADPRTTIGAVIGTGKQALPQAAALVSVLPITSLRVQGRDAERRKVRAAHVEVDLCVEAVVTDSVAEAVDGAGVITTATRATEPFLAASMVASGAHVNAIGAITPERAELYADLVDRSFVVTDSVEQARALAREVDGRELRSLSSLVGSPRPASDLTLFKAMGIGLADVALGRAILEAT